MNHIEKLTARIPELNCIADELTRAANIICEMHKSGKKLLICGNGGSAADSEHISGELLRRFNAALQQFPCHRFRHLFRHLPTTAILPLFLHSLPMPLAEREMYF